MNYDSVRNFLTNSSEKCLNPKEAVGLVLNEKYSPSMKLSFIGHCISVNILSSMGAYVKNSVLATAFTEPKGGSSLKNLETIIDEANMVSGVKYFVTNGAFATHFLVLAQKKSGEHVLALVKKGENVVVEELPLIVYENSGISKVSFMKAPGEPVASAGKESYINALKGLVYGRLLISALAISLGLEILEKAVEWASSRTAEGQPLIKHEIVVERIGDTYAKLTMLKHYVEEVSKKDLSWTSSSIAKYLSVELTLETLRPLMKVFGGYMFLKNTDIITKYLHILALEPAEGTSDIQLKIIMNSVLRNKNRE